MRRFAEMFLVVFLLGACQQTPDPPGLRPTPATPFSLEALRADPARYVDQHYAGTDMPTALATDLTTQGFTCTPRETATECVLAQPAFASCFDVWSVRIEMAVQVEVNRRCTGAMAPPQR